MSEHEHSRQHNSFDLAQIFGIGNQAHAEVTYYAQMTIEYLAGYFDGEGCICIQMGKTPSSPSLRVTIVSGDEAVLHVFEREIGGTVYPTRQGRKRRMWRWSLSGRKAADALRILEPHLVAKRKQAQAVLACEWETHGGLLAYRGLIREQRMALRAQLSILNA